MTGESRERWELYEAALAQIAYGAQISKDKEIALDALTKAGRAKEAVMSRGYSLASSPPAAQEEKCICDPNVLWRAGHRNDCPVVPAPTPDAVAAGEKPEQGWWPRPGDFSIVYGKDNVAHFHSMHAHEDGDRWHTHPPAPTPDAGREFYGQLVRMAWVEWAKEQPDVSEHPSWLVSWADLPERDREVDRRIGEAVQKASISAEVVRLEDELTALRAENDRLKKVPSSPPAAGEERTPEAADYERMAAVDAMTPAPTPDAGREWTVISRVTGDGCNVVVGDGLQIGPFEYDKAKAIVRDHNAELTALRADRDALEARANAMVRAVSEYLYADNSAVNLEDALIAYNDSLPQPAQEGDDDSLS